MATSRQEAMLDQIIEKLGGGGGGSSSPQEPARLVKRTEVANMQHKRSMLKYIIIGIVIILIIAAIIYFIAKTSHGKGIQDKLAALLPFGAKRKKPSPSNQPQKPTNLVAERIDFTKPPQSQPSQPVRPPPILPTKLPRNANNTDLVMDPSAVPIRPSSRPTQPPKPLQPPRPLQPPKPPPPHRPENKVDPPRQETP